MSSKEKLIYAVKEHRCLYDFSCKEYRNENLKKETWDKIAASLNESAEGERDFVTGEICHKRWKSLRDIYVRKKKKIEAGLLGADGSSPNNPKWEYWDAISWMDNFRKRSYNNALTICGIDKSDTPLQTMFIKEGSNESLDGTLNSSLPMATSLSITSPPLTTPLNKKRIHIVDNKSFTINDSAKEEDTKNNQSDDKFDLFGKSVAIQLRELKSPYLAMKTQTDIQNVIFSAYCADRNGNNEPPC